MKNYAIGIYEKAMPGNLNWREKMETAKAAGYDFIEISIDETDEKLSRLESDKETRRRLVDLMYQTGLPVRSMCLSGHRKYPIGSENDEIRERGMQIMEKALILAEDLGIRIIQLAGYDVYYEEGNERTRDIFTRNLKKAADMAARHGVLMGFETMETEFMNTVGKAMDFVREINSPYLNVYPDLGNITNAALTYKTSVTDDLEAGRGHIVAMHLKETLPGKFREIPFGTGHVDFESGIKKAWDMGVRRFVTEFWYKGSPVWRDDIAQAIGMMKPILEARIS